MSTSLCSVCLAGNLKMKYIDNIELQNIFEKLTSHKHKTSKKQDGETAMCFMCYWQLRRCRQFADKARKTANVLAELFDKGFEATKESVAMLEVEPTPALAISNAKTMHTMVLHHADAEPPLKLEVFVKLEETADDSNAADRTSADQTDDNNFIEAMDTDPASIEDKKGYAPRKDAKPKVSSRTKLVEPEPRIKKRRKARVGINARTCEFCNKVFKRTNDLRVHRRMHTGEKPYRCDQCDKSFASSSTLIGHKSTHIPIGDRPKPFACSHCDKTFRLKDTLQQHVKTHGERRFACEVCGKAFVLEVKLKQHAERHKDDRAHTCDRCAKTFKTIGDLRHHMVVHSAERRHACAQCDKTFIRGHDLTLHLRVHSGEKPYSCRICGRAFSQSSSLTAHALTHSAERPFSCEICGFRFKDKFSLAKHSRTHAAGPPSACTVCGRECATRRGAQSHARSHARAPVSCTNCGKTFCDVSRMRRHERNVRCTAKNATRVE